jgi:purine-cytosine permease-like protein
MLGAAFGAGAPGVPTWEAGLGTDASDVGGLVGAVLDGAGGFGESNVFAWRSCADGIPSRFAGKFLTALIALTIPSAVAPTMYSFSTSLMAVHPALARVPRYVWAVVATAMCVSRRCISSIP